MAGADAVAAIDPDGRLVAVLDETRSDGPGQGGLRRVRGGGLSLVPEPSDVRSGTATTVVAVQRWYGLDDIPADLGPTVVTLGNFDGVHRGHREVLTRVVREAADRDALPVAVTFEPHPIAVLYPDRAPAAVMSLEQRLDALDSVGLGAVLVIEFTREFAQQTPEEFVRGTFVDALGACAVVVGKDTRFGVRNSGDVGTLRELGAVARVRGHRPRRHRRGRRRGRPLELDAAAGRAARRQRRPRRPDPRSPAPGHRHRRAR